MRNLIAVHLFVALISPVVTFASPTHYSAGPTWGQVVDAGTGEPVAGAVVIARWDLEGGMERSRIGTFKVFEATTDAKGNFSIPPWGPEPISSRGQLDAFDPTITIFKSGYTPEYIQNGPSGERGKRLNQEVHDWAFNGGVRKLRKDSGSLEDYSIRVSLVVVGLFDVLNRSCKWKEIPRTIRALDDEEKRERAQGVRPQFSVSGDSFIRRKDCGPLDEFAKIYSGTN